MIIDKLFKIKIKYNFNNFNIHVTEQDNTPCYEDNELPNNELNFFEDDGSYLPSDGEDFQNNHFDYSKQINFQDESRMKYGMSAENKFFLFFK